MAFPRRLLHEDEDVLIDVRPHWIRLSVPVFFLSIILGGVVAVFIVWKSAPDWVGDVLGGCTAIVLIYFASHFARWRSTNLVVTTHRVIFRSGVVRRTGREIPIERVQDVTFYQHLFQRIVGAGSLVVESGGERGTTTFSEVRDPAAVQTAINRALADDRALVELPQNRVLAGPTAPSPGVSQLEQLGELFHRGIITASEFEEKKAELLARM